MKTVRQLSVSSSTRTIFPIITLILLVILFSVFFIGCSDSTSPDTSGGNGDPEPVDWPVIPQPSAPYEDTAPTSDTLTVIHPLTTNYRPNVVRALCSWSGNSIYWTHSYAGFCDQTYSDPIMLINLADCWSNAIAPLDYSGCSFPGYCCPSGPIDISRAEPYGRVLLLEDGGIVDPVEWASIHEAIWTGSYHFCPESFCGFAVHWIELNLRGQLRPIEEPVYLRRDRYWQRVWIADENSYFKVLIGDTEYDLTVSYTSGTSTTETETFGRSVTTSGGLDFGFLKASVEVTISQSFSTSVTLSEETTVGETYKVFGEDGKYVQFQVWEGVEIFTITDAEGNPYTDLNYVFEPDVLYIHGNGPALVATKFDYP